MMTFTMLLRSATGLLRIIDASFHHVCQHYCAKTLKWRMSCISSSQLLSFQTPCQRHHVRQLTSDTADSSSSSDSDTDELCVYQPDVRRVRIVTMNDVQTDDVASSQSSVQRDTVYIRQHVSADDPTVQSLFQGICEGSRSSLARAITLVESVHPKRRAQAQLLLREVLEYTRKRRRHSLHCVNSFRIGNIVLYHILTTALFICTVIAILFTVIILH